MPAGHGDPLLVTTSVDEARREVAGGRRVVLIVAPGEVAAGLAGGGGEVHVHVHVFVGDPADPATQLAAAEMAAELGAGASG